jgi:hypothetical protein
MYKPYLSTFTILCPLAERTNRIVFIDEDVPGEPPRMYNHVMEIREDTVGWMYPALLLERPIVPVTEVMAIISANQTRRRLWM